MNINNNDNKLNNFEPTIIKNSYYSNYSKKKSNQNFPLENNIYNNNLNNDEETNILFQFFKKLFILSNIEGNIVKIFGIDKIWIPLLMLIKKYLLSNIPILNKYLFKEKSASLTITYTHFTSTYYNQQNNSSDYIIYKSILCYIYEKKPFGCKFTSNTSGNLMFLDQFDEIQINKKIWLVSKNTTSNTSSLYILELSSYICSIDEINNFIKQCLNKYKTQIQTESLITTGLKYYKYLGMNNSSHQCMFDEYPFTQTKSFSNIFFTNKESFVHKIKYFSENEETYQIIGRPYTMGIMLYGKPGTGKTSCIKAIAAMTQRHIIDVSLKKIKTQKELNEIFYGNKINGIEIEMKKKLFILEEFDCIIEKLKDRKNNSNNNSNNSNNSNNINETNDNNNNKLIQNNNIYNETINKQLKDSDIEGVNLEHLLCLLDGTNELCGSMFVATTNYINLIDKALIRPGRFDCCIDFDNASFEIIIQMIKHFSKKNLIKLKKKHFLCKINSKCSISKSSTSELSELSKFKKNKKKLTNEHIEIIKKFSIFNNQYVWSPAKISQICLFYIDSVDYYDNIVMELEKQYDNECNLLK
jgi:hypothetical protein